jgi:FkbM family methyltransferase
VFWRKFGTKKNEITTPLRTLKYHSPNALSAFRVETLFTKEPETMAWIDKMQAGTVLYDIGANIGMYSVYAAQRGVQTFAFEPSPFNIEILFRNIVSNDLHDMCVLVPISLTSKTKLDNFYMSKTGMICGGAHNSIMKNLGFDGKSLENPLSAKALSFTLDEVIKLFSLPNPTHLKIDVDGLEMEILRGAKNVLKKVTSVLIEVSPLFSEQLLEIEKFFATSNFRLVYQNLDNPRTSNQIWQTK